MSAERFSDEMLMRFADGELSAEEMAVVEKAMETDDDLVARVAMFIDTKAEAQAALKPLLDEPVPEKLQAAVEGMVAAKRAKDAQSEAVTAKVVPFQASRQAERPAARQWTLPLAASIAAAVIGGMVGYRAADGGGEPQRGLSLAGAVEPAIAETLVSLPAGDEAILAGGERIRAIATFRNEAQQVCREFELDAVDGSTFVSVACHEDEWRVHFTVAAAGGTDGYAPASSTEALDAYLSAIEAGEPLSAEEEARALEELRDDG